MPIPRRRPARPGGAALLLSLSVVLSVAVSGCAITRDEEPGDRSATQAESQQPTPTKTVTVTPTPTPTETVTATPTPRPGESTPVATDAAAALLGASEMPPLNDASAWTEKATGAPGTESFGACQKFDLNSIGAMSTVERTFTSGGDSAGQQVADFADAPTAIRAARVLRSWHDDCRGRLQGRRVSVGPVTSVPVARGTGWHYLARWTRGGTGHFHSFGVVLSGTRLSLLRIDHTGQDHNYEPGQDPMELAVKAASTRIGA